MNKKGFTLVEVIVSVVLVSVIMVSMLSSLVKLRETYTVIHENSDVIVYTSSIARVINNDLMKNNGVRYANCSVDGRECELILGNDKRRHLSILEEGNGVDLGDYSRKNIKHEKVITTLRYTDSTGLGNDEVGPLLYIRTLSLDRYTKLVDGKESTTEGYNFYDMNVPDAKTYTKEGINYVDTISTINIRIWDGKSSDSTKYDIALYSSGRYDESGLIGKTYAIKLDTAGAYASGTVEIDEVFGVAYFDSEKNHSTKNIIKEIDIPKKKDESGNALAFLGYFYYKAGDTIGTQVIDSTGRIVSSSRTFKNDIAISNSNDEERVVALWGVCDNGYKVNARGECVPEEYTVTLDKNGGSGGIGSYKAEYKSQLPTLTSSQLPSRSGYEFGGYFYNDVQYHDREGNGLVMYNFQNDITIKAAWNANNFTVAYDGNSNTGGSMSPKTCTYDQSCTLDPNGYSRKGYSFTGWKKGNAGDLLGETADVKNAATSGTVTYYAQWKEDTYTIQYELAGGSLGSGVTNPTTYTINTATFTLNNPTRSGYTFKGWTGTGISGDPSTSVTVTKGSTGSRSYTATWELITYTVTYKTNTTATISNMPDPNPQTKTHGTNLTLSSNVPTRSGYNFTSWNTKADNSGTAYAPGAIYSVNSSVTLYAQWDLKTYTVTYYKNTTDSVGSLPSSQTKTHGVDLTLSNNTPTRSGYTFNGWNTQENGNGTNYAKGSTYSSNANLNLYAKWEETIGNPYNSYKCANIQQGSAPFVFTYTGNCERNGTSSDWWFKFLTDGNLTLTKKLYTDLFLVGGGGLGNGPSDDPNCTGSYPDGTFYYPGCKIGAKGGGGGSTKTLSSITLNVGTTYAIDIGDGGHCTGPNQGCDTVAASKSTSISNISGASASGGSRGGGAAKDSNGTTGTLGFGSSTYGRYSATGGGGCSLSSDYDGKCYQGSGGGNGYNGAGHGCNSYKGAEYPISGQPSVHATDNSGGGGGGGSAWCVGSGGSGIVLMRKQQN